MFLNVWNLLSWRLLHFEGFQAGQVEVEEEDDEEEKPVAKKTK